MTITITSEALGKQTKITREQLRKIMIENWNWEQSKADSHLIFLEMHPHVLTIQTPKGELKLQAL